LLKNINFLILDIYQKSFCNDLVFFRDDICKSINKVLPFDAISWHYLDNKGKEVGTICTPSIKNEGSLTLLENLSLNKPTNIPLNNPELGLVSLSHNNHQLTAFISANDERRGHKIKLIRQLSTQCYSDDEQKLFELLFPHIVEGLSMVLMNSFKSNSRRQAIGVVDRNHHIIEADDNFLTLLSSVIKKNTLLLNVDLMNNKKTHQFNNVELVINQVSDFYVIYANTEKKQELTQQEHNVMMLLTKGETNKKIATALTLSPSTINNHLTHIFKKLRVNSRISAVQEWKKNDK